MPLLDRLSEVVKDLDEAGFRVTYSSHEPNLRLEITAGEAFKL
jgi:hypothetical protein